MTEQDEEGEGESFDSRPPALSSFPTTMHVVASNGGDDIGISEAADNDDGDGAATMCGITTTAFKSSAHNQPRASEPPLAVHPGGDSCAPSAQLRGDSAAKAPNVGDLRSTPTSTSNSTSIRISSSTGALGQRGAQVALLADAGGRLHTRKTLTTLSRLGASVSNNYSEIDNGDEGVGSSMRSNGGAKVSGGGGGGGFSGACSAGAKIGGGGGWFGDNLGDAGEVGLGADDCDSIVDDDSDNSSEHSMITLRDNHEEESDAQDEDEVGGGRSSSSSSSSSSKGGGGATRLISQSSSTSSLRRTTETKTAWRRNLLHHKFGDDTN